MRVENRAGASAGFRIRSAGSAIDRRELNSTTGVPRAFAPDRERARSITCYGTAVPECAFTCEISDELRSPFAVTSRRKFALVTGCPD